jgi:feruloyl esterase
VHVVAVAAKAIQAAYYGRPPIRSYWQGCSDGGREGLMEAQRYPDDFDGIVVGAPALYMEFSPLFLASAIQANTGPGGAPILTLDKLAPLHDAVVKACDGNDGVTGDGLIGDPRDCSFDPGSIRCPGADAPACLTSAQVAVVRTIYAGAHDRSGRQLDPRMTPRGSELTWAGWWVPAPAPPTAPAGTRPVSAAIAFGESAARWLSYPLGQGRPLGRVEMSLRDFAQLAQQAKYYDAVNPNLEAFRRRGGKLMIYQGLADALVPPSSTLEYFNAVRETMGGPKKTDRFARLFLINGMNHCAGGPTPNTSDLVLQMVRWVENGAAPESITAGPLTVAKYAEVRRDDDVDWAGDYLLDPRRSDG